MSEMFAWEMAYEQWRNEGGAGEGGLPRAQVKKEAQNELTGIYFDTFWGQMVHKGGK